MTALLLHWLSIPLVHNVLMGVWGAASVDLFEWMKVDGWRETGFNLGKASKRWVVGGLGGLVYMPAAAGAAVVTAKVTGVVAVLLHGLLQ